MVSLHSASPTPLQRASGDPTSRQSRIRLFCLPTAAIPSGASGPVCGTARSGPLDSNSPQWTDPGCHSIPCLPGACSRSRPFRLRQVDGGPLFALGPLDGRSLVLFRLLDLSLLVSIGLGDRGGATSPRSSAGAWPSGARCCSHSFRRTERPALRADLGAFFSSPIPAARTYS